MEILIFVAALILFDVLAMRFGVDSRNLERSLKTGTSPQPQL